MYIWKNACNVDVECVRMNSMYVGMNSSYACMDSSYGFIVWIHVCMTYVGMNSSYVCMNSSHGIHRIHFIFYFLFFSIVCMNSSHFQEA